MPSGIYLRTKSAWNKDISPSKETRRRMSLAHKGIKLSSEHRLSMSLGRLGKKRPDISEKMIGKSNHFFGKKHTLEARKKNSVAHKGEKHPNWKGGITPENLIIRESLDYRLWRQAVFERDNYICKWCKIKSGDGKTVVLNADHIKTFAYHPELRFDISNGQTLCENCHKWKTKMDWKIFTGKVPELNIV